MKKKYISNLIVILILCIVIFSNLCYSYASQKSDLQDKKDDVQEQIDATNSEIAGVKEKMSDQLNQITRLNSQIGDFEAEISTLEEKLSVLNGQIDEKAAVVAEKEKNFKEQQALLEKRLVALYETGTTSYLDLLLSSNGLSDFISKYYLIAKLTEYDNSLLNRISNEKQAIENEKAQLENSKKELEASKNTLQTRKSALDVTTKEKTKVVNNLSAEEKELQQKLDEFEQDKKRIEKELRDLANSSSSSNIKPVAPSASGYLCPIPGKSKKNITTGYYGYSGHTGVDFAVPGGTPIVAVKSGTVVTSMALKSSNGSYRSYGEYIVIDHHDGTMTLYAHGMPGSRAVEKNQKVSQGQQIMKVGTTGNSTGYHLHFEVRIKGRPVDPTDYLP